ncbi:EAL domain-containing protein [Methylobacterium sp. 17Sr1-1]|uniref:bifunctional diguanylate cyclase/phosphodiesterase n=1 Tax=Methylobacterium sp. 17Sr1-1 TaxID=2202826 RepID=UPI000D70005F|nr:EAL domain-containing protein [Methylobacterium sp. 17Sr1-1]AWN50684.1 PAS domain S-box protein [Methylobacterium sp. 17Sr1-1]
MYRAFVCLTAEHTVWAVPLAALVAWFSCLTALQLFGQARAARGGRSLGWLLGAAFSAGAGTWSTHFIAMLGYDPGVGVGYDPAATLASLLVGVAGALAALGLLRRARGTSGRLAAGLLLSLGVAAMHATGMQGVHVPGTFVWHPNLAVAALVVGAALSCAALVVFRRRGERRSLIPAATLLAGGIVLLHLLAMAAAEVVPDPRAGDGADSLPRAVLAAGIAAVTLAVLACSALALVADRLRRMNGVLSGQKAALLASEERMRALTDALPQMVWVVRDDGTTLYSNRPFRAFFGARAAAYALCIELQHPDDRDKAAATWLRARTERRALATELRWRDPSGAYRFHKIVIAPALQQNGVVEWIGTALDIDDMVRAREALQVSEERLALALDASSDGLWDCDLATGVAWTSDRWWHMLGYAPGELPSRSSTWRALLHPDDRAEARAKLAAHLGGATPVFACEHRLRRKDGTWGWFLTRSKVVARGADGRATRIVGTHVDIGVRKEAESRIAHMAAHDALTDLPNRTLFRERLRQRLSGIGRGEGACAVLCVDLDRFKEVNDALGHLAGDALLREVALRLRAGLSGQDIAARLGGDEFAVLLAAIDGPGDAMARAQGLVRAIGRPIRLGDQSVEIGASIGIAASPADGTDEETLVRRADLALYKAKAEGRNAARAFDPAMDLALAERRQRETDLRRAIARDELVLHYQPQVRPGQGRRSPGPAFGGTLVGFEALVRWRHPSRGLVPPGAFIPLAEETGLVVPLGEWVLRAACGEAAGWARPLTIAVNLSPRQFQQVDLPERVLAILTETGLPPERLEIEVTETVIINDMARALSVLRRLKSLGIRIAMDDFGTGYSSLATLQAFPFDTIKIDRSFVSQLERRPASAVIVRAVLGLGTSLGIRVVAEGVETEAQMRVLLGEGCAEMQGYLFGKPQPVAQLATVMAGEGVFTEAAGRLAANG